MLSRTDSPFLLDLPLEWSTTVKELLETSYQAQLDNKTREFEVFGRLHKGELVVIASLINTKDKSSIPTTYFVSIDLTDGQDYTKNLDSLVDSIGGFFDTYFSTPEWMDYKDSWEEEEFKGQKIFYKINRENVGLTIMADQLLNQ
ncbi:hypothetical protein [Bacteriovorax sp. Seq25_V]|uniref:hypothetical protein n=1 Tax=Bacteriovorax sp. Seq25_V TaxID=1201288 RepID=UPI00038A4CF8|nr:hypothetical protein [Bacteriovorax sp. Seq25_V]EQC45275.1 hypothetical protein M900_2139 [Bacteriovorax sp. Seq25_V]